MKRSVAYLLSLLAGAVAGAAHAQTQDKEPPFVPPTSFELVSWVATNADWKIKVICQTTDGAVVCKGSTSNPDFVFDQRGKFEGNIFSFETISTYSGSGNGCSMRIEYRNSGRTIFKPDGTHSFSDVPGTGRLLSATPACGNQPATIPLPAHEGLGTWAALGTQDGGGFSVGVLNSMIWSRIGLTEGPLARRCFDETMPKLNEARNAEMRERLEGAALRQHYINVASEAAARADDFVPGWQGVWDRMRAKDLQDRLMDRLVKLLPGPLKTLYEVGDAAHRASTGINDNVMAPYMKRSLFEAYVTAKANAPGGDRISWIKDAGTLRDAGSYGISWEKLVTDLAPKFPGATQQARINAMANALGTRFDFLQRVREVAADREKLSGEAWREADADLAKIRMSVLDCMAK